MKYMKILYTNVISVEAYLRDQDDYKITSMIFTKKKSNPYTVFAPLQLTLGDMVIKIKL